LPQLAHQRRHVLRLFAQGGAQFTVALRPEAMTDGVMADSDLAAPAAGTGGLGQGVGHECLLGLFLRVFLLP